MRARWVVLAIALIAALAAVPSAATAARVTGHLGRPPKSETPTQVIDAQTDPEAAGQALNDGCVNLQNCSWQATSPITVGWDAPKILGDVLYNCTPPILGASGSTGQPYAETAVGVSDEREESTSISESVSVEISLGFLGFEENTAEFEAFSKQSESFSTEVTTTSGVAVPPMWKGYTTTSVRSANVSGDAYITAGINKLIEVKDMDLSFPGYAAPGTPVTAAVAYIGNRSPMSAQEISTYCGPISGLSATKRATAPKRFAVTVCTAHGDCRDRRVSGTLPPLIRRADATLRAHGRVYASGTVRDGRIRLTERRTIGSGTYHLVIRQRPKATRSDPRPLTVDTTVPVTFG